MPTPETPILDEAAVSEIEARYERAEAKYLAITQGKEWWRETETPTSVIGDSLEDIPALCATVKHLRAEIRRLTKERDQAREDVRILTKGRFIQS